MSKKMLIDAAHPEETRVVIVQDNRVEHFDFESATKTQIRGNIYLAKVTRIEPSLQAAFVDYGGNRHGFLAFNEIHPDYYQIPVSDREALIRAEQEAERAAVAHDSNGESDDQIKYEDELIDDMESNESAAANDAFGTVSEPDVNSDDSEVGDDSSDDEEITAIQLRHLRRQKLRSYKIQEVIRRRQIILVQIVKEERGHKGAALTTYLSFAGRYCVLIPNTGRGGGISRKIKGPVDRRRLKKIVDSLEVPDGMGLVIRTAGAKRTKAEVKRDYEYLLRLWEGVRSLTLESIAPSLVYEEGSLVKRAVRDLYSKEIDTILVDGEESYHEAKGFMRMLMPSHAKNVKRYKDDRSIFQKYNIESQLDLIFSPHVQLKSGGYIVINPTEALVAIDVNSGRATRERSIEKTALETNLEAAEEVARQCRLRDLAGLIVVDFIDMEENENNRTVEKRLKECLKNDRARVRIGRISNFGLLELSRQRIRPSVLEGSTSQCSLCNGTGVIRSTESTSLRILRTVEEQGVNDKVSNLTVRVPATTANYLLNQKRSQLRDIESYCGIHVIVDTDTTMASNEFQIMTSGDQPSDQERGIDVVNLETTPANSNDAMAMEITEEHRPNGEGKAKRRRRRPHKVGKAPTGEQQQSRSELSDFGSADETQVDGDETRELKDSRRRRRRGRRGGKRHTKKRAEQAATTDDTAEIRESEERTPGNDALSEPFVDKLLKVEPISADDSSRVADHESEIGNGVKGKEDKYESHGKTEEEKPRKRHRSGWWQRRVR